MTFPTHDRVPEHHFCKACGEPNPRVAELETLLRLARPHIPKSGYGDADVDKLAARIDSVLMGS